MQQSIKIFYSRWQDHKLWFYFLVIFSVFSKFSAMNTSYKTFFFETVKIVEKMWEQVSSDFYMLNNVSIFLLYPKKEIWESLYA